jgi:nucleoside-diphosphate-sugar epimerase
MSFQKPHIALAGATGNLGLVILDTLLSAGYTVTTLTRHTSPSISKLPSHPNLTVHPVDFTSVTSLITALLSTSTKASVVISALATLPIGAQNPLIDACGAAGVERFIPAEFGLDS